MAIVQKVWLLLLIAVAVVCGAHAPPGDLWQTEVRHEQTLSLVAMNLSSADFLVVVLLMYGHVSMG